MNYAFEWLSRWKNLNKGFFPQSLGLLLFVFIVAVFLRENKLVVFPFKLLIGFVIVLVGVWIAGE